MSTFSPPTFVCFSPNQQDEECSCMTQLSDNEYPSQDGIKLSADPYFFYALDKRRSEKTEKSENNNTKDKDQEIIQLKMQIARQQERIEKLSSDLQGAECENELLKAENTQLINELSLPTMEKSSISSKKNYSHQQVLFDVMRKSFKNYIKDHRHETQKDNKVNSMRQMNEDIYQQSHLLHKVPTKISFSEITAKTLDLTESSQEESHQQYGLEISHRSGSTWTTYSEGIGAKCNIIEDRKQGARSRRHKVSIMEYANLKNIDAEVNRDRRREANQELLVGFDAQRRGRRRSIM